MSAPRQEPAKEPLPFDAQAMLGPDGPLARGLAGYEFRQPQVDMASLVWEVINAGGHAVVEAGTGTGKSLAYLLPALHARRAVLVSTYTINLQEQLLRHDLPRLREWLGLDFRAALMKGRGNFICRRKVAQLSSAGEQRGLFESADEVRRFRDLAAWCAVTETGDRAELEFEPRAGLWAEVACAADDCHRWKCKFRAACYYYRARAQMEEADLVVCNHALFMANFRLAAIDPELAPLGPREVLVFDEAHHLADVAANALGLTFTNYRIPDFARRARHLLGRAEGAVEAAVEFDHAADRVEQTNRELFERFPLLTRDRVRLNALPSGEIEGARAAAAETADRLTTAAVSLRQSGLDGEDRESALNLAQRAETMAEELPLLFDLSPEWASWVEVAVGRRQVRSTLHRHPVEVAAELAEGLFENPALRSVILTSATLAVGKSFAFMRRRLGIAQAAELLAPSPFDYAAQCLAYAPSDLPPPDDPGFPEELAARIERILRATQGRAFVLFTSYRLLDELGARLTESLPYPVLRQGEMPKWRLLEQFKRTPSAVLLGTDSFWEGVDVQGEQLSCIIITRLPFTVPDEPLEQARVERIEAQGGNAFREYSLPRAVLKLKQGFGRLIRTRSDRGLFCVLDSRLHSRSYGRWFAASLPPMREIAEPEEAGDFLAPGAGRAARDPSRQAETPARTTRTARRRR
ncbi:MAG TPA: helicase C-terminal domain-containing protein [Armatimonadota bacterium]|nr:helicase C-terminal domain-containing protein [Armatimonadota bacterium]